MRLPIEYWKNTLAKLGMRVERRYVKRRSVDVGCSFESLERRLAMSIDSPVIAGFLASPATAPLGSQITLTATGVTDPNGDAISHVRFYRDIDNDGVLSGADGSPLGTDTDGSNGWSISASTAGFPAGTNRFFAVAKDATDLDSDPFAATNTILSPTRVLDDGESGFSIVSGTWQGPSNSGYNNDHYFSWFNNGVVEWRFTDVVSGTYRVSATWTNSASNSAAAPYDILDGTNALATTLVNQKNAPAANVTAGGRNFQHLGEFEIVNGELVVRLTNTTASAMSADAIRLEHIGPAVSASEIRVYDGSSELFDAASTINLGSTFIGTEVPKTLTVKNVGVGALNLTQLTQGVMPAGIKLVSGYASTTLAQGETTTFTVALAATALGSAGGTLSILNNDPNEAPFDIALTGVVNAVTVKDDGDSGYSVVSGTWQGPSNGGYNSDHYFSWFNNGAVEWQFANLIPGEYRVSATWTNAANRAASAPYLITGGDIGPVTALVNQKNAPAADATEGGRNFQHLGKVHVVNGQLVVRLTNTSATTMSADAIRLEYLPPAEIRVLDGATELTDGISTVNFGSVFYGTPRTLTVQNDGPGTLNLTQLTQGAMPAGFQLVSGFGSTALAQGQSTTFTVAIASQTPGTVSGTIAIQSNDLDERSFDIQLTGVVNTVAIKDDGDSGYSVVSGTWQGPSNSGYNNDHYFSWFNNGAVEWRFANLLPGAYRISATWTHAANRAAAAPYDVIDGTNGLATVLVNQRNAPAADATAGGRNFQDLGQFEIVNGELVVRLTNTSATTMSADAVRLEYVGPATGVSEIRVYNGSTELHDAASTVNLGSTFFGTELPKTLTVKNVGVGILNLTQLTQGDMPAGYRLVSGYASTTLAQGETTTLTVAVTATQVGTVAGALAIVNNDPNEASFDIQLTSFVDPSKIIDDEDAGFTFVSGTWNEFGGGYGGDHRSQWNATGGVVEWSFANLPEGSYRVSATWPEHSNRGTNVPYTIYDGSLDLATVRVNQKLAPAADVTVSGRKFQHLGAFSTVNGSIVVRLTNSSDGASVADAIRIEYLGAPVQAPEIRVFDGTTELADNVATADFGTVLYGTSNVTKTFTVTNVGLAALSLTPLTQAQMPAGYELVSSFGSTTLARGESTTFQVRLLTETLGTVAGTFAIASNDGDEGSFEIALTGQISTSKIIDDEDPGFSVLSGTWTDSNGGYAGDHRAQATTIGSAVTWTYDNLLPGKYRVSATWPAASGRTTVAPYAISDGAVSLTTVEVNQRVAPTADFVEGGRDFETLGTFAVSSGTFVVQLTKATARTIAADAIRLEYLGELPEVQFTGSGPEFTVSGAPATELDFGLSERTHKAIEVIKVTNSTGSALTLTQVTQQDLPAGYLLLEGFGTLSLAAGASTYLRVRLDALTPGTYSGTIPIQAGAESFNLAVTGEVIATPVFVDNSDPAFVTTGTGWLAGTAGLGFEDDYLQTSGVEANKTATWTVEGLADGPYLVYVSYRMSELNTAAAPFKLYDGTLASGTLEKQVAMNQRLLANDITFAGQGFELLELVDIDSSTLTIELDASMVADGFVLADAIYVVPATVGSFYGFSAPSQMITGDAVPITVGVVDPDGTLFDAINLYRDTNANGVLDVGIDQFVHSDTTPSDGFNFNAGTLAVGTHNLFVAAMQGGEAVMSFAAAVTSAQWWEVEILQYRTDGERLFTTTGDLVANPKPIKLEPGQTWQDAVYARVCGTVTTENIWEPATYYYSFPHTEDDGTPCVIDDGSFDVNTQDILQATWFGHSLGLPADTKMIVLEDLTGTDDNDYDYDDQYWIVNLEPYNIPEGQVIFGIEEQQFPEVLVAQLEWHDGDAPPAIAHIDWGDGSITAGTVEIVGATIKVKGSHSYPQEGPYGVAVMIHVPSYNYVMFAGTVAIIENVVDEEQLPHLYDSAISGYTTTPLVPTLDVDYDAGTYSIFATGSGGFDFNFGHQFRGKDVLTHTRDDGEAEVVLDMEGKFSVSFTPYCPCDTSPTSDITTPLMTTTYSLSADGESGFMETYDGLSNDVEKDYSLAISGGDLTRVFEHTKTASFSPSDSTYSWFYNFSVATFATTEDGLNQTDRAYYGELQGETREDAKNLNRRLASKGLRGEFDGNGNQAINETWTEKGNYHSEEWDRHRISDTPATTSSLDGTNQTESFEETRITDDFYESHKFAKGMIGNISYSMNEETSSSSVIDRVTFNQSRTSTRVGNTSTDVSRIIEDKGDRVQTITSSTTSSSSFVDVQTNTPPYGLLVINSTSSETSENNQDRTVYLNSDFQVITGTYSVSRIQQSTEVNQTRVVTRTTNDSETRVSTQTGKVDSVSYTLAETVTGVTTVDEIETNQDLAITRDTTRTSGSDQTTYQTSENEFSVTQAGGATSTTNETELNQSLTIVRIIVSTTTDSFSRSGTSGESSSPYIMSAGDTVETSVHSVETNQGRVVISDTNSTRVSTTAELGDSMSQARSAITTSSETSTDTTTTTNQGTVSIVESITERNEVSNQAGNSITGVNSFENSGNTTGTFTSLETNQTRTVDSEGTNGSEFGSIGGGNAVLGDSTSTNTNATSTTTTSTETNQLLTISSTQTVTTASTTTRTGNSISGLYVMSANESSGGESNSTETNQGRTVVSTGTNSSSTDTTGDGNSVITTSTVTNTGTSSSNMTSIETNQELTVSATQTSTGSSSSTRTGNAITGLYTLSANETSDGTSDSTETNQTRTVVSSGTNTSSMTTTNSGNSVLTESTVTNTGTSSSSMTSTETNQELSVEATQTSTGSSSSTRTGNAITGLYTLSGNETSDGASDSTEINQTRTVVSSGTNNSSTTTTGSGNSVLTESTVTNIGTSSSSMTSTETNQVQTVSATQTSTGSSSSSRTGNAITGLYTLSGNETSDGTSDSTETNQTRTVVSIGTNSSSMSTTGSGNSVLTESIVTNTGSSSSSMTSTETNQDLTVSATQTSTGSSSSTRDGNAITGIYTLTASETSDGDSNSTETNKTRTVVSSGTNSASSSTDDNGNSVIGESTVTKTGSSSSSMTSTQTNQSLTLVATQSNSGTSTVSRTGNVIVGSYTATGTETTSSDSDSTETNQTRTIISSGSNDATTTSTDTGNTILGSFSTSLSTTGSSSSSGTELNPTKAISTSSSGDTSQVRSESGNRIVGAFEGTSSYSTTMTGTINTSHQSISGTGTFSSIDVGESDFSGHSISATRESQNTSTVVRTQNETLNNQSLVVDSDQDNTTTTTEISSGNSILGSYESSVFTTATSTLAVEDSNNGLVVSTTDTNTEMTDSTSSGNENLGNFTSNSTVTREATVTKNYANQGILVVESTLTSASTTTSGSSGNQILGNNDTESTTTTNSTLVEEATNQTLTSNRTTISDVTLESTYSTNTLTGVFESTEDTSTETSIHQTDNNQSTALATIDRFTTVSVTVTSDGNDILGDVTSTTVSTSTTTASEVHTNQTRSITQVRTDTVDRTVERTENSFTGIFEADTTGTSDFTLSQTHTNTQGLALLLVSVTQSGSGTLTENESGNSVVGSYTRETETSDSDSLFEIDTNQVRTVTLTRSSTADATTTQTGSSITGSYSLGVMSSNGSTSVEINVIDPFSTITVISHDTSDLSKTGNEIDGSYELTDSTTSASTFTELFTNKTLTVNITEVSGGLGGRTETGNAVAGTSNSTSTYEGSSSLLRTESNQTLSVTIHETSDSTSTTTHTGNSIVGGYLTTTDSDSESTRAEESTNQTRTISLDVVTTSSGTSIDDGNSVTGLYTTTGDSESTVTTTEYSTNKSQTIDRVDTSTSSVTTTGSGNNVLMSSTVVEITTVVGSAAETDTNQSLTVTGADTYTSTSTLDRTSNAVTGLYTELTTAENESTLTETAVNQTRTVSLTKTADSTSTATRSGNSITGAYTLASSSTAADELNSVETNKSLTILAGQSSTITTSENTTGSDRYEDFETTITTTSNLSTGRAETNQTSVTVATRYGSGQSTQVRTGNYVSGTYLETSDSSDTVSLYHVAVNQTSTDSLFQVDTSTTTAEKTGNEILGDYVMTSSTDLSYEIEQQDDNTSQAITGNNTGTESSSVIGSGNDITGLFSTTTTGTDTTDTDQSGTIGDRTFTLSETSTREYTRTETGDSVFATASSSETSTSDYTLVRSDTYTDGTDVKTLTTTGTSTVTRDGNSILGTYVQQSTGDGLKNVIEEGNRGNTYSLDSDNTNTFSTSESGNSVTGLYELSSESTDSGVVTKTATQPLGGSFTVSHSSSQTASSKTTGDYLTGDYELVGSKFVLDQIAQNGSASGQSFSVISQQSTDSTEDTQGNRITGLFSGTHSFTLGTILSQSGVNTGGTYSLALTSNETAVSIRNGNEITGDSTAVRDGVENHTVTQSSTDGANKYDLTAIGVKTYERTTTASSITGETTQVETGTDDYTMQQTGIDGLLDYTQDAIGEDTYTIMSTSNDTADGLDKTLTGTGNYTWVKSGTDNGVPFFDSDSGTNTFGLEETGTYVDGNLVITQTGTDRYDLLQQFNNPSAAVNGLPGTVDFSPVGGMVTVGIGVAPPTGGAGYGNGRVTVEGIASLLMGGYGSQSHANIRGAEATGLMGLSDGWVDAGAGLPDGYAGLGHQLALEYCFAAGTKVLMADGSFKAIETIEAGERVMAVSDRDPMGNAEPRQVVRTFHNAPNELLELYLVPQGEAVGLGVSRKAMAAAASSVTGQATGTLAVALPAAASTAVIRTTLKHPLYVVGRGWIEAESLEPGDQLRTSGGGTAEVAGVRLTGAVEPVFNLEVVGHHTYFVAADDESQVVLVHNESVDEDTLRRLTPPSRQAFSCVACHNPVVMYGTAEDQLAFFNDNPQHAAAAQAWLGVSSNEDVVAGIGGLKDVGSTTRSVAFGAGAVVTAPLGGAAVAGTVGMGALVEYLSTGSGTEATRSLPGVSAVHAANEDVPTLFSGDSTVTQKAFAALNVTGAVLDLIPFGKLAGRFLKGAPSPHIKPPVPNVDAPVAPKPPAADMPIQGSGGPGKVYEIPGSELTTGKPYIGKTRQPTVADRMKAKDHKAKTPTGEPPKAEVVAENLTIEEMDGLEALLIERRGLDNLTNKVHGRDLSLPKNQSRLEAARRVLGEE